MDQEARETEKGADEEEEDVIPSSQGRMFSSQSSTPDLLSSSHIIPILHPSQSISATESDSPHQLRAAELLASTPSIPRPDTSELPTELRPGLSETSGALVGLGVTSTGSATPLKRPRLRDVADDDDPETSPPDKRLRALAPAADDSDVQFVEEVEPDVRVVFSSQEPDSVTTITAAAAATTATAESQAGFRLSLSQSQSAEVTSPAPPSLPAVPAAETGAWADPPAEQVTDTPAELSGGSPAHIATDTLADPSTCSGAGRSGPADQPTDPSFDVPRPPPTGASAESIESAEARLPHIQTPQVTSFGNSASPPGADTVFGHAQRLIEEQNRRQELHYAESDKQVPPSYGQRERLASVTLQLASSSSSVVTEPTATIQSTCAPIERLGVAAPSAEDNDVVSLREEDKPIDENRLDSQTSGFSLVAEWRSMLKSSGHASVASSGPQEDAAGRDAQATGRKAKVHTGVDVATAADMLAMPTEKAAMGAKPMAAEKNPEGLEVDALPDHSAGEDPYRFHSTQSQETQPFRLRAAFVKNLSTEAKKLSNDGYCLGEIQLTWRKDGKEPVVRTFPLDEHDGATFLRRLTSSSSSNGSSLLSSSTTAGGYTGDVSSKSSAGSGPSNRRVDRQSTMSSVTLSTIEGRGARHSVSSSVDALPAPGRRSVVSVRPYSPGSDGDVQVLSPPAPLPAVPEFTSPDRRPPRPHGQPSAVSSLRSGPDEPSGAWPAATSTQAESGSEGSHVTGSSPSPEVGLQPPLSAGAAPRPLTDQQEDELSEREQCELPRRPLQPDGPCFALWGADNTYYPGRLVSEGRADRWLVRFDDATERLVPAEHVLPVVNLWKGLSVFVQMNHRNVYEAGLITGHRVTSGAERLEYIVSLDSQPTVTSAVPRSWLSLTRDQAALIRERRRPNLGQLAVGSPSRHLSLDNLVTGRRRAAGAGGARRLANFEQSCGDSVSEDSPGAGSIPASSRCGRKATSTGSRNKVAETAKETASPADVKTKCSVPERCVGAATSAGASAADSPATLAEVTPTSSGGGRRGSRLRRRSAAARLTPIDDAAAVAAAKTSRVGGRKRVSASTPTGETTSAAVTPGGRRSRRVTTARKASEPVAAPVGRSGRGRKRAAPLSSSPEPGPTRAGSAARKTPAEPSAPGGGSPGRKRLVLTPSTGQVDLTAEDTTAEDNRVETGATQPLTEIPDVETTLLSKHTFILTCIDDSSVAPQPTPWKREILPRFDKEHVTRHIEAHGGHVLKSAVLSPAAVQRVRKQGDLLLIANGPLRTAKYVCCLAMGVPCVQLSWLENSIGSGQCLPYEDYLLPAGHDPETGESADQLLDASPPLARLRVLLAAGPDSEWGQLMAQILAAAGAKVNLDRRDPAAVEQPFAPDVVVAEADCPQSVLVWARQCTTPVVSGEWVVGCVVKHRRLGFTARPEFDYSSLQLASED